MRSKFVVLLIVIVLLTSIFTGCTEKEPVDVEGPEDVEVVKIGAILPLTGGAAATGVKLQAAMEVAGEIINGEYPDIAIPLAEKAGLPNLNDAKIEIIFADHQGNPEMAKSEAERLIEEGVVGLVGSYQSSATKPASQASEQYGLPL